MEDERQPRPVGDERISPSSQPLLSSLLALRPWSPTRLLVPLFRFRLENFRVFGHLLQTQPQTDHLLLANTEQTRRSSNGGPRGPCRQSPTAHSRTKGPKSAPCPRELLVVSDFNLGHPTPPFEDARQDLPLGSLGSAFPESFDIRAARPGRPRPTALPSPRAQTLHSDGPISYAIGSGRADGRRWAVGEVGAALSRRRLSSRDGHLQNCDLFFQHHGMRTLQLSSSPAAA